MTLRSHASPTWFVKVTQSEIGDFHGRDIVFAAEACTDRLIRLRSQFRTATLRKKRTLAVKCSRA